MGDRPTVSAQRRDPLRTFQFRVRFEGDKTPSDAATPYIAGVRSVSGLSWNLATYETWSGGNNLHPYVTPNRVSWDPITLEQGIARDGSLEAWAEAARVMVDAPSATAARAARRNVRIDVWDHAVLGGTPAASGGAGANAILCSYVVYNAWVRKYVALPRLDAMTSEIALASVEIAHEGWRREAPPAA